MMRNNFPILIGKAEFGNAVLDAVGVQIYDNPITPEKVWRAIKQQQA